MRSVIGFVVIGRNEGERLRRCLESILRPGGRKGLLVYVDSGSTDGSVQLARSLGAEVVELEMTLPFTAARARNTGLLRLCELDAAIDRVQFVDGDCELAPEWVERGAGALDGSARVGMVGGRLRERHPEASVYNRLCDIEWDTPIGETAACGGIAMARVSAVREAGMYDPALIAGEEPELCLRMRRRGWTILRIDAEMAIHDAALLRFGQWWRRAVRSGHAYAEGAALHGSGAERYDVREAVSIAAWGIALPLAAAALAVPTRAWSLAFLLGAYAILFWRIRRAGIRRRMSAAQATTWAFFCALSKFPGALGLLRYVAGRMSRRPSAIIEHKQAAPGR